MEETVQKIRNPDRQKLHNKITKDLTTQRPINKNVDIKFSAHDACLE